MGSQGRISQEEIFDSTCFKTMLSENTLNLPQMGATPGTTSSVIFVFLLGNTFLFSALTRRTLAIKRSVHGKEFLIMAYRRVRLFLKMLLDL